MRNANLDETPGHLTRPQPRAAALLGLGQARVLAARQAGELAAARVTPPRHIEMRRRTGDPRRVPPRVLTLPEALPTQAQPATQLTPAIRRASCTLVC